MEQERTRGTRTELARSKDREAKSGRGFFEEEFRVKKYLPRSRERLFGATVTSVNSVERLIFGVTSHAPAVRRGVVEASAAFFMAIIAGCAVGPDYKPPQTAMPGSFHSTAEQSGPSKVVAGTADIARWWSSLKDPMLDSLVDRAVGSNLDVKIAASRVREARAQRGITAAAELPSVDANGSYSRSRTSQNSFNQQGRGQGSSGSDLFQVGFDASWEVDVFGGIRRSVEAADAEIQVAEESRRDVLVSLLAELGRNYVETRTFQRRILLADNNIALQKDSLDLTLTRFNAGLTSELDVAQARAQLETRRSQVPPLRIGLAQSVHRLGVLLGQEPGALLAELNAVTPIPSVPVEVPLGVPSELLRRRPDVRRAERDMAAASARVGVATSDLYPKFSLTGAFGLQSQQIGDLFDLNSRFWSIGPSVRWPVFEAGRIRANIEATNAREEQAILNYSKSVLTSLEETENAITSYSQEQARRAFLAESVVANRRAYDLANQLYTSGLKDFLNVLEAQRTLYEAEDQLAQSDRGVTANLIALYKALGGGWESFEPQASR